MHLYDNEPETTLKQIRVVSVFYFSFISHIRASEIEMKQICFISVLFHIRAVVTDNQLRSNGKLHIELN